MKKFINVMVLVICLCFSLVISSCADNNGTDNTEGNANSTIVGVYKLEALYDPNGVEYKPGDVVGVTLLSEDTVVLTIYEGGNFVIEMKEEENFIGEWELDRNNLTLKANKVGTDDFGYEEIDQEINGTYEDGKIDLRQPNQGGYILKKSN